MPFPREKRGGNWLIILGRSSMIDWNRWQNLQIVKSPSLAHQSLPKSYDWYFLDSGFEDITPSSAMNLSPAASLSNYANGNSLLVINTELGKYYTQDDWNAHEKGLFKRFLHVFDRQLLKELLPEKDVSKAKKLISEEDWDKELCQQKKNNRFPAVWYSRKFNPCSTFSDLNCRRNGKVLHST